MGAPKMKSTGDLLDPLTGALARTAWQDRLTKEIKRARRNKKPLTLALVDLDHFKSINDAFGYTRGDEVLREFADYARSLLRKTDLFFRHSGDEFAFLLPNSDKAEARIFADRLLTGVRERVFQGTPPLSLSLSIGCAGLADDDRSPDDLFERANRRLHEAKIAGRGCAVLEDADAARRPIFQTPPRLVERDQAFVSFYHFLDALAVKKRGIFRVTGSHGAGRSRFLGEIAKLVTLRGYEVLMIHGSPALRSRRYGALADLRYDGVPPIEGRQSMYIRMLSQRVVIEEKKGLLMVVDNLPELDQGTLELLRTAMFSLDVPIVAVVYTADPAYLQWPPLTAVPLQSETALKPFSLAGTRIWLRNVLNWEAPVAFSEWLHRETDGLPGLLEQSVSHLIRNAILQTVGGGWTLSPIFVRFPLRRWLNQKRPVSNLPSFSAQFVGREKELNDIKLLVENGARIVISGPGGVGKTRLAAQAAAELAELFPDGVYFVPLISVRKTDSLPLALARALRLSANDSADIQTHLFTYLRAKLVLLVFDQLDHLADSISFLTKLQSLAPHARMLLTSREPIVEPGWEAVALRGLPVPAEDDEPPLAGATAAEQLFLGGAHRNLPQLDTTTVDWPAVQRLCRLVDGLPLAIELLAAWIPLAPLNELAAQLERRLPALTIGTEPPDNERILGAVFDCLWEFLAEAERRCLGHLSVFRGEFDYAAAQTVAGASLFFLSALVDRAFILKLSGERYALQGLLREYARGKLAADAPDQSQILQRHAAYFVEWAERAESEFYASEQTTWLERFDAEYDSLSSVLDWALSTGQTDTVVRLAAAVGRYWALRGYLKEGHSYLDAARTLAEKSGDPHALALTHDFDAMLRSPSPAES